MKKVLVTGGCGFIGSWACEYFVKEGWRVISYDNMTKHELIRTGYNVEKARNYNWEYLKKLGVELIKADIRNKEELFEYVSGCDFIIHTAAQPAMTISIEDPELDFTTNVLGTINILEAAKKFNIPVVSCSTIHVYGNKINYELKEEETRYVRQPISIDESHPPLGGTITPLHASKFSGEVYVRTYIETYKVKAASFRLTGLYGPRQLGGEDHGWVANFVIRAILGLPITIYGTGKQVRDILYASDVVEAFLSFYRTQKPGIYNIGGGIKTAISLLECVNFIKKIINKNIEIKFRPPRHGDLYYFVCDTTKAKNELGWEAKVLPEEGIVELANWIKNNLELFSL